MKLKRTLGALLLTVGVAALPLHAADAAPDDQVKGSACADIAPYHPNYPITLPPGASSPFVSVLVDTAKPSCTNVTYTLDVYRLELGEDGTPQNIGHGEARGNGEAGVAVSLLATLTSPDAPAVVCVSVASTSANGKVIDSAPNAAEAPCPIGAAVERADGTGGQTWRG